MKSDAATIWLRRGVYTMALLLLCVLTAIAWNVLILVRQSAQAVAAAQQAIANETAAFRAELDDLHAHLSDALDTIPLASVPVDTATDPAVNAEIEHLLETLAGDGIICEYGGKTRPGRWVAFKLRAKSHFANGIKTTEDFIERVAAKTHEGHVYYVIQDGRKGELKAWLADVLASRRREPTPPPSTAPPQP